MVLATSQRYADECAAVSPSRATAGLYGEAITSLRGAITAIGAGNIEARCNAVKAATEIITTLYLHLDFKQGREIADNLGSLYNFMLGRLLRINLYNDPDIAEQVIDLLSPLRDSWAELDGIIAACNLSEVAATAADELNSNGADMESARLALKQSASAE
jgi:flagellar protein FliS